MKNVKMGDVVKATGFGALFVGLVQGSAGHGEVVHVENPEGIAIHPEVIAGDYDKEHLTEGLLYKDAGNGTILWLAPDDFEIVSE